MDVQLLVRSNSEEAPRDYVFPMKERVVLGRSPESVVPLEGVAISREHLILELVGDAVYATDLSNNGTWINGNRLKREERIQLSSGDSVEVPDYQISFSIRQKAEARLSAPEKNQTDTVKVITPPEAPPIFQSTLRREPEESLPQKEAGPRLFTLLEIVTLLLAVLALGLIAYYAFLVS